MPISYRIISGPPPSSPAIRSLLTKRTLGSVPVDVNVVIRGVAELVQSDAVRRHVKLTFELEDGLPPVLGDVVQLQQVVLNLIMNGFEAMQDTAPEDRRLLIRTEMFGDDAVCVAVQDSGIGLAASDVDTMFAPFQTTKEEGLGMGLAISRSHYRILQRSHRSRQQSYRGSNLQLRFARVCRLARDNLHETLTFLDFCPIV